MEYVELVDKIVSIAQTPLTGNGSNSDRSEGLVVKQTGDRLNDKFFPTLEEANVYLDSLPDKIGIMCRESNLEDIFVELSGTQLN